MAAVLAFWGLSVLLVGWLILQWGLLPRLEGWRPFIEQRASATLGVPVRIGGIRADTARWVPAIDLRDVRLLDAHGNAALVLPHVRAAVSPRSLWGFSPHFLQLHVAAPELDVRRDALGRLRIGGLELSARAGAADAASGDDEASSVADWFFRQTEFVVRGGRLTWTDEQRLAPAVTLEAVDLVLRNSLRRHDLRLDATPPAAWGDRFSLRGHFVQELFARPSDWRRWSGNVYAELPRVDLLALRRHVDLPVEIQQGDGALRAWIDVRRATVQQATVDLALREVAARLATTLPPLAVSAVEGRLVARRDAEAWTLDLRRFGFTAASGTTWPRSDLSVRVRQRSDPPGSDSAPSSTPIDGGDFRADRLDLAVLAELASQLPLGAAVHRILDELQPQGIVTGLEGRWDGPPDAPARYRLTLRGERLGLEPGAIDATAAAQAALTQAAPPLGRPGFRGASVTLQATERGGEARLDLRDGSVTFPGLFEEPRLAFATLATSLTWTVQPAGDDRPPRIEVRSRDLTFANADARGTVDVAWSTGPGLGWGTDGRLPGTLDLTARIGQAQAARVVRYLPQGIPQASRDWVRLAVQAGTVTQGQLRIAGPLWDFPFFPAATAAAVTSPDGRPAAAPPPAVPASGRIPATAAALNAVLDRLRGRPVEPPGASPAVPAGEFKVVARVRGGRLAYVPDAPATATAPAWASPWPAITDIDAELRIDRQRLEVDPASARIGAVQLSEVRTRIPDLQHDARVQVDGRATGPGESLLGFVANTPVRDWTRQALDGWTARGDASLRLSLDLPLADLAHARVLGEVDLAGNDLDFGPDIPPVRASQGRIGFTERGFEIRQVSGRAVGGNVAVEGGTRPDGSTRITLTGTASADGLRTAQALGFVTRVADALQGVTPYEAQIDIGPTGRTITVTSMLVGIASSLPPPLAKASATPMPLRVEIATDPAPGGPGPVRDRVRVALAEALEARYQREWTGDAVRVTRGWLGIGAAAADAVPDTGRSVVAQVRLPAADLDAWRTELDRVFPSTPAPTVASTPHPGAASVAGPPDTSAGAYAPNEVRLAVDALRLFGRTVHAVQATWVPDRDGWQVDFRAREGEGRLNWRSDPSGSGRLQGRLARLDMGTADPMAQEPAAAPTVPATGDQAFAKAPPPALALVVDDLRWRGQPLGRMEVDAAVRASAPGLREWRLQRLVLATPEARLAAEGPWIPVPATQPPTLAFRLDVTDTGDLLERLGSGRVIRGGRGHLSGELQWVGSPLVPDPATLGGRMTLALDAGQFLKVDPGAGRLLGVLSLQALPRRLVLDFRDVFQEGFAFDAITGDVGIDRGIARTNNLRMRGVQAAVLMEGSADLRDETQDLRVVVVPEINAGTASLAYAAINPVVGVGTFLAQLFLRRPLAVAGTREFHITGPWSDPKVVRVERPTAAPADDPSAPRPDAPAAAVAQPPPPGAASGATPPKPRPVEATPAKP